jgi:hypothetical protein
MKLLAALGLLFLFAGPVQASEDPPFVAMLTCQEPGVFLVEVATPGLMDVSIDGPDEYIGVDTFPAQIDFWGEGTFGFAWGSDTLTYPGWVKVFVPGYEVVLYNEECGEVKAGQPTSYPAPVLVTPPPIPAPPDTATAETEDTSALFIGMIVGAAIALVSTVVAHWTIRRK